MKHKKGFCALDEFAKGTNPDEGELLVRSFLEYSMQHDSFCLAATHYSRTVTKGMSHFQVNGLKNSDFEKLKGLLSAKNLLI